MERLAGKVALITGTAGGQGRAAALRFAQEGARVVGCDRNQDGAEETVRLVRDAGGEMVTLAPLELTSEDEVRSWVDFAVGAYGDFDILYNNASAPRFGLVEEMALVDWHYTLDNELTLLFLAIKHAVPVFVRRGGGCILNTASVAAEAQYVPGGFAHAITKAGVIAMTRSLAVELSPLNVRVNAIAPGIIDTPAVARLVNGAFGEAMRKASLIQRYGLGEDTAAAAVFLCSDEASFITGATIPVDGGVLCGPRPASRISLLSH
jgi:NAD(P)-dependent dehydrogenase (short-subunit alcohol dehydrogenase family)